MNLCIVFDRDAEALPTLPFEAGDTVHWIPSDPGFEARLGEYRPHIVVLDLRRCPGQSAEAVARVRFAAVDAGILVIGAPRDVAAAEAAMRAGATGYVTRTANLVPALQSMRCDRMFISTTGARAVSLRIADLARDK